MEISKNIKLQSTSKIALQTKSPLRLRPYKPCDAKTIVTWCKDEVSFRKWCSDRWENFPITAQDMNEKYIENNGDCSLPDNFYPMTAFDETGIVGHLILRFTDIEKTSIRFGFVIVDDSKRGLGYGKEMLTLALKFSFEILKAKKVTLGVFDNNMPAYHCYKAAGFKDVPLTKPISIPLCGETWNILELALSAEDYCRSVTS